LRAQQAPPAIPVPRVQGLDFPRSVTPRFGNRASGALRDDLVGKWARPTDARFSAPRSCAAPSCKIDIQIENDLLYPILGPPMPILNITRWLQTSRGYNLRKVEISARMAG